ncbi:MAG: glycoside hydrolase family 28 protein [Bacteroidota bacterium]
MRQWIIFLIVSTLLLTVNCSNSTRNGFSLAEARAVAQQAWEATYPAIEARIQPPSFPDREVFITTFGADTTAQYDNRPVIQAAIEQCAAEGGGRVVVPAGNWWVDGPLHLRSNINLHLQEGAKIYFGSNPEQYLPLVKVRWEGTVCWSYSPFIYAFEAENIAITGAGEVDGQAQAWSKQWRKKQKPDKKRLRQMGNDLVPEDQRVFGNGFLDLDGDGQDDGFGDGQQHWLRPTLVELYNCKNILLEGVRFRNSAFWTIHPVFSQNITIRNLKIEGGYLNDDGIDPDSCEDVLIEDCRIETEDDAISIKAGRDQDAWNRPPSQHIIVRNCTLNSGVNAFCIGSEMSGGVQQVFVHDCRILSGKHGLNFKCNLDRGGRVADIFFRQLTFDHLAEALLIFRMDYHGYRGNNYPTKFERFFVQDVTAQRIDSLAFKIVGVEAAPIEKILLDDIRIQQAGRAGELAHTEAILWQNVFINGEAWEGN